MNSLNLPDRYPLDVETQRWIARLLDPQYRALLADLFGMCLVDEKRIFSTGEHLSDLR
jgi:hypothetical protein